MDNLNNLNNLNNIFGNKLSYTINEDNFTFTLPIDDSFNIFDTIESLLNDIQHNTTILNINNDEEDFIQLGIEFDIIQQHGHGNGHGNDDEEDDNNYFKSCSEINDKVSKSQKIKEGDKMIEEQCFICMDNYKLGEFKRVLPTCTHCFHKKCIDKWLKKKASCPICRDNLLK